MKKKRTAGGTLDAFYGLAAPTDNQRVNAACNVLHNVGVASNDDEGKSFEYILARLVKGLASGRDPARRGYFSGLVELLRRARGDEAGDVADKTVALIREHLNHKGSKSEEGEFLCGQLLGYGALLRSDILSAEAAGRVAADLLAVTEKRNYLRLPGFQFVTDALTRAAAADQVGLLGDLWPAVRRATDFGTLSLEKIWLALVVHQLSDKALDKKFLLGSFGSKKLVSPELFEAVSRCLADSSAPFHVMRRHPVFPALVAALRPEKGMLLRFWKEHQGLEGASHYRVMLGFTLLDAVVSAAEDGEDLSSFLTSKTVESALNCLSRIESPPEEDAFILGTLDKLGAKAAACPASQVPVLRALMTSPGSIAFDKISGGHVVHNLVAAGGADAVRCAGELYRAAALGGSFGQSATAVDRVYAVQQLARLTAHPAMQGENSWKSETLSFLLTTTLFSSAGRAVAPLEKELIPFPREAARKVHNAFFKGLDFKARNLDQMAEVMAEVFAHAEALLKQSVPLASSMTAAARAAWDKVSQTLAAIAKDQKRKKENSVFRLLFLHLAFHLLSTDRGMAVESLQDLFECFERSKQQQKQRRKSAVKEEEDEEPHWVEVVVDVLVSLQAQDKHVLRQMSKSVLVTLSPHITDQALEAVLDVINPPAGEKPEDEEDDEEKDSEDDDWEDIEDEDNDVEEDEEEEDDEDEGIEDGDEDSEDDSEEEKEEKGLDESFRSKVKTALGEHAAGSDDDDDDEEEGEEDEVDMDDISEEDMKKMDEALSNVFRQLSGRKGSAQKRKEKKDSLALLHFRIRTLDLLDAYMANRPAPGHVLAALQRCLAALEASGSNKAEEELRTRLASSLRAMALIKKSKQLREGAKEEELPYAEVLQSLVDLANRGSPVVTGLAKEAVFSHCCLLVLRLSRMEEGGSVDAAGAVDAVFQKALDDFFSKSLCMMPVSFFMLAIGSNWSGCWAAVERLRRAAFDEGDTRMFRRTQALALLTGILTNKSIRDGADCAAVKAVWAGAVREAARCGGRNGKFIAELIRVMYAAHVGFPEAVDDGEAAAALEALRPTMPSDRRPFQEAKKEFNRLAGRLKVPVVKDSDRQKGLLGNSSNNAAEDTDEEDAPENRPEESDSEDDADAKVENGVNGDDAGPKKGKKKKKKKKGHSKAGLEERKRHRQHALEGQFEGMEMPSFSGLALSDNMNFQNAKAKAKATPVKEEEPGKKVKKAKKRKSTAAEDDEEVAVPKKSTQNGLPKKKKKKAKSSE